MKRTGAQALRDDLARVERSILVATERAGRLADRWEEARVLMEGASYDRDELIASEHRLQLAIEALGEPKGAPDDPA